MVLAVETSRMRIGMVCPYSLSIPGGVQAQAIGLTRELRKMGHEVRLLGPCDGPPPETFVTPLGNSLPTASNGSIVPIAPDPSAVLRTIRVLREEQFEVLHVHEPLAPGVAQTTLFMNLAPIVGTFHAAGESNSYKLLTRPLANIASNLARRVVVSKDAQGLIQSFFGGEYSMLFNGVELDRYETGPAIRRPGPSIFFCGRHEERKGLNVLLEAMALLPANVRCLIASDGPDTKRLKQQYAADTRIEWLGRLSDADKAAYLRGASVFCAPSLHGESFGVVLIEAMAAGTPVVASSLDGYMNVATDDVDAALCPPGDREALAKALSLVLDHPDVAQRYRAAGRIRAREFSMASLASEYERIYREMLLERPPQPRQPRLRARWARSSRRMIG
jgi:phosphatidyl-myo-inositol alpha-mannosyltransferase